MTRGRSVARVSGLGPGAHLAADVATPMKRAAAPLPNDVRLGLEPSPAAHQVTAVHTDGGGVALPATSPVKTDGGVVFTEVGRALEVDQVSPSRLLVVGICRVKDEAAPSLASHVAFIPCSKDGVNFIIRKQPGSRLFPLTGIFMVWQSCIYISPVLLYFFHQFRSTLYNSACIINKSYSKDTQNCVLKTQR